MKKIVGLMNVVVRFLPCQNVLSIFFQFEMVSDDEPDNVITAPSATACLCIVLTAVNKARWVRFGLFVNWLKAGGGGGGERFKFFQLG